MHVTQACTVNPVDQGQQSTSEPQQCLQCGKYFSCKRSLGGHKRFCFPGDGSSVQQPTSIPQGFTVTPVDEGQHPTTVLPTYPVYTVDQVQQSTPAPQTFPPVDQDQQSILENNVNTNGYINRGLDMNQVYK